MPVKVVNVRNWKGNGTYIGRSRNPDGVFGNPYSHLTKDTLAEFHVPDVATAIRMYREVWVPKQWEENGYFRLALTSLVKNHLRGELVVLACFCKTDKHPDALCHGEVLKELIEYLAEMRVVTLEGGEDAPF